MNLITYLEFQTYHEKELFWKYYTFRFILQTNFLEGILVDTMKIMNK